MIYETIFMVRMRPIKSEETSLCEVKKSMVNHIVLSLYDPVNADVPGLADCGKHCKMW